MENTRREWNGLIVDVDVFEQRNVRSTSGASATSRAVPQPRPISPPVFVGPIFFTLAVTALPGVSIITPDSTSGMTVGDSIGIYQDDGTIFNTIIAAGEPLLDDQGNVLLDSQGNPLLDSSGVTGPTIGLVNPLPLGASAGNLIIDYRVVL